MELKFERMPCRCLTGILREVQNIEQTQELRLPDGMPDVGRVIAAWGQVMLRSKEWRGDGVGVTGGVTVWVLYGPDDGGDPQCIDLWLPFQGKWSFPETDREGIIRVNPVLRSVDARTVSGRKLMIRAGIGIWTEALITCEPEVYTPGELPDGVELLRYTYPVRLPRDAVEKTFLLDEELTLPGTSPAIQKLLRFELIPQLVDSRVMAGKVVFRGNGLLHILYWGEDGRLHTWDFEIPFSQFAELQEEFGSDGAADIVLAVTSLELDQQEDGALRLKCGLVGQCLVTDQVLMELAEDAYSTAREVEPSFCESRMPIVLDERSERMPVELVMDLDCGRVIDTSMLPDHPNETRMGEQVKTAQSGTVQLLYEDNGGGLQATLRRWEQEQNIEVAADSDLSVLMSRVEFPNAQMTGGQVTVRGNVRHVTRTESLHGQRMMAGMVIGDVRKPDPNRPSVILRRMEGERLWDLAKSCGSTVQAICRANDLTEEPDIGRMLLIPVM